MKEFKTKGHLIRMALEYALQDRIAMRAALSPEDEYLPQVEREIAEFRAYLKQRFQARDRGAVDKEKTQSGQAKYLTLDELRNIHEQTEGPDAPTRK